MEHSRPAEGTGCEIGQGAVGVVHGVRNRRRAHAVAVRQLEELLAIAESRHFISRKHRNEISEKTAKSHFRLDNWQNLFLRLLHRRIVTDSPPASGESLFPK